MSRFHLPPSVRCVLAGIFLGAFALAARAALDAPVSPNALPGVAAELQFFKNIQGRYIVSGQQEFPGWPDELSSNPAAKDVDFNYIKEKTGRIPGVRGFDFLFYTHSAGGRAVQHSTERAIEWAKNGGLVAFCCHMFMDSHSPAGNPQFYVPSANNGTGTTIDIRQAVIDGTPENIEMLAKFDLIAAELKKLRDAGVIVIWRPFHECSGGWFWWGANGPAAFKQAWQIMFTRFTQMHGLTNLIWCYNPTDSFSKLQDWYPGDEFVDMISLDVYPNPGSHPTYATDYQRMRDFKAGRKVVVMSENGTIPDIDALFAEGGSWGYFCTWNGFESDTSRNSVSFLNTVFNHARVVTRDELPSLYSFYARPVAIDTQAQVITPAATLVLTASVAGPAPTAYQWQRNGVDLAAATGATLTLANVQPADTGLYVAAATGGPTVLTSGPAIVGIATSAKFVGTANEVGQDIQHSNGNVYDQVLLTGSAATITTDTAQVTRTSFLDLNGDIVQVEFSGPGTLSVVLADATAPALPAKYNQNVAYEQGHASIVITGADERSNVSVFSVGRVTAVNQSLFRDDVTYDGFADIAFIAIASPTGKFGGIRTANTHFFARKGYTGIYAPGVQFTGPVRLHDLTAFDAATPVLLLGSASSFVEIAGGDLAQDNHRTILVSGLSEGIGFVNGTDSHGQPYPAKGPPQTTTFQQNGVDITSQLIGNPTP